MIHLIHVTIIIRVRKAHQTLQLRPGLERHDQVSLLDFFIFFLSFFLLVDLFNQIKKQREKQRKNFD